MIGDLCERIERLSTPEPNSGCWLFQQARNKKGYGITAVGGKHWLAHRLSWVAHRGPIPDGMLVCHRCDTPACVNPDHLFLGTNKDNMADMVSKGRGNKLSGEKSGRAKLCREEVLAIMALRGKFTGLQIADMFGVSGQTVSSIHTRAGWRRDL